MPIIEINKRDLERILKKKIREPELENLLRYTKISIESIKDDVLTLEIKDSNRQDLLSVEGISRELFGIMGKEKGIPEYNIRKSDFKLIADRKVKEVRPEIACCVVRNIKLDNYGIKQIIQLQEKLCEGLGRKRKEAAIGIYDFDKIRWPVTYTSVKPDEIKFVPLGMKEEMTPKEILQMHEKGKEYAHLIENAREYPLLIDSEKNVLSMPPVINSDYSGKIDEKTRNLFVEVTGMNFERVSQTLNIVAAALADRNGQIFSVNIENAKKITPQFRNKTKILNLEDIESVLGIDIRAAEIVRLLEKARYDAKIKKDKIEVAIPFYRIDVIHPIDIIEDIAILYGYHNIPAEEPKIATTGSILPEVLRKEKISGLMIGLGFQETASLNLTNKNDLFKKMHLNTDRVVEIENPVSSTYSCLRNNLLPSLMNLLSQNTSSEYPQKVFEIGQTANVDEKSENKTEEMTKIAIAVSHSNAGFTEMKQTIDYLFRSLKIDYRINSSEHPSFIPGRIAEIIVNSRPIGIFGEIHPKVIESWKLEMPVSAAEIDLTGMLS
jgi:phenylalanyl-tRNA synthetase beta chain